VGLFLWLTGMAGWPAHFSGITFIGGTAVIIGDGLLVGRTSR
jgi:hypothetical protein